MSFALSQLHGDALVRGWGLVEPILARALGDDLTTGDLFRMASDGRMMIWAIHDGPNVMAAAASGVKIENGNHIAEIQTLSGRETSKWLDDAIGEFENLAYEHGIDAVRIVGRKGYARRLPDYNIVGKDDAGHIILMKWIR